MMTYKAPSKIGRIKKNKPRREVPAAPYGYGPAAIQDQRSSMGLMKNHERSHDFARDAPVALISHTYSTRNTPDLPPVARWMLDNIGGGKCRALIKEVEDPRLTHSMQRSYHWQIERVGDLSLVTTDLFSKRCRCQL